MSADPVVVLTLRLALACLFAAASLHKLRDPAGFRATLRDYQLLPAGWVGPAGFGFALLEAGVALALLAPAFAGAAAGAAAALLGLYAFAIAVNLARGRRHVACGCLGPAAEQPLHAGLLARNAVLALAALAAATSPAGRPFGALDAFTVAAAAATLASLYLAADGLMAAARLGAREPSS